MKYKISIIMPVYNAEKDLKTSIESIINQTLNLNEIELILVDDKSTDKSREIIQKYCRKYENFKLISLKENIGAAYGPRNIGLEKAQGKYIMFLDSDDKFHPHACKTLYNAISKDPEVDIAFARYQRIYPEENLTFKGYSPYEDEIKNLTDDLTDGFRFKGITKLIWDKIGCKLIYGTKKPKKDEIVIKDIKNNPEIFKILPSIWTKIYKKSFIEKNQLKFPEYISGEDLNFITESFFKANKIIFLNNNIIHNYYMRKGSITKKITYPLVYDSLISYYNVTKICEKNQFRKTDLLINPFLLNWINLYFKSNLNKNEKKELKTILNKMSKTYKYGLTSRILVLIIKILLK